MAVKFSCVGLGHIPKLINLDDDVKASSLAKSNGYG